MRRVIEPELLDSLPPDHPDAVRTRRDLRRVNRWMRNDIHLARAIGNLTGNPQNILEIGSGDGTFMLRIGQMLSKNGQNPVRVCLLDREPVVRKDTLAGFAEIGWQAEVIQADLHEWVQGTSHSKFDLITANLFLHHFSDEALRVFFRSFAVNCHAFVSCEPRRWKPAVIATRLLWAIGCNHVTRHDAYLSVRAGFRERELSQMWPQDDFSLSEYPAGYASHLFTAVRRK